VGEVLPLTQEDCASGMDQNCDGTAEPCTGNTVWAERFGDTNVQAGQSLAVDALGNVVVTGLAGGTVDFGGGPLMSAGGSDIFVAKFDPSGALLWAKLFGDALTQAGYGIAVDTAGNVLVTGQCGAVDFGGGPLKTAGGGDIFVAKFDPKGMLLWAKLFGDQKTQTGMSIAVDTSNNVLVTGRVSGTVDFGGGLLTSSSADSIFIAKLDPMGGHIWSKLFADGIGNSVAVDGMDSVFVTGFVTGTADFGAGPLTSAGQSDMFVAKFGSDGTPRWSKLLGDAQPQIGAGIAADATGAVVTGFVSGSINFGGNIGTLTSAGGRDIVVAKLASDDGTPLWAKLFGDATDQEGASVAIDPWSNVAVTGYFNGMFEFGGKTDPVVSAGLGDIFVAKFDPNGVTLWARRFGDPSDQGGLGVATDTSSNVFVTGYMEGTVDFGIPPLLMSMGGEDIFVAKLSP
jgi:hypothetical protein